jgi:cellulose synthase (UDP-forming)
VNAWLDAVETAETPLARLLRILIFGLGVGVLLFGGTFTTTWQQQVVFSVVLVSVAVWLDRRSPSYLITLTLMLVSCFSTFRYGFWRVSTVVNFLRDPGSRWTPLDVFFILILLLAECYAFLILYLGYMQTLWPLRRTPVPLPDAIDEWPEIDLFIPTYNEPLSVVRFTALAAINIDWPADRLNVYILDDGHREEFRLFAEEAGVGYITRDNNRHAKAGNINSALTQTAAPYVVIFDCDHVPTRSFLQVTMGWFLRDPKLGVLQTPHHFYSPDPFERNLDSFRSIPNEGELFYGIVQDGNDFWNATFFCGSCAVLRREALEQIGGIAVETVTEDAHTSLRMQMHGWNTAYINIPQAAGLATERLSGHVKQRIRWARGMVQILRTDNPLFAPGLTAAQRLCYFNAMTHFLYALPRLIFLSAPLIYLVFFHTNVPGYWLAIFAYALPHLVLANITNSRIQGQHRHSFWNEIYETVLAPYILLPTLLAFINPKLGSFNVTAKGGVVKSRFFDSRIAMPFLVMILFDVLGLLMAIPRYVRFPTFHALFPFDLLLNLPASLYDGQRRGTIVMNVLWTLFNLVILGVATAVAWESQQRRQTVRVTMTVPADIVTASGEIVEATTADISSGGVMMSLAHACGIQPGDAVQIIFPVLDGDAALPATAVGMDGLVLRAQFDPLTLEEEEALTMVLYSRADTWLGWGESRERDRPLASFYHMVQLACIGLRQTAMMLFGRRRDKARRKLATPAAILLAVLSTFFFGAKPARAQSGPTAVARRSHAAAIDSAAPTARVSSTVLPYRYSRIPVAPGSFDTTFQLADFGVDDTIVLRGVDSSHSIYFSLPQTEVVRSATMHLRYHFSPGLLPTISHLKVSLNGTLFATLPVMAQPSASSATITGTAQGALLDANLSVPAEMLVHHNQLTFEFIGHYTLRCEDPSHSTLWSQVDANSTLEIAGSKLPLQDDLKLLPMPFYDSSVDLHPVIPIVFLTPPSPKALEAAGLVASWFGVLANSRSARFPVSIGRIPPGNAIVLSERSSDLPAPLSVAVSGPTLAMRPNPSDPYAKVLVLTGDSADDLRTAAAALALQQGVFESDQQRIAALAMPAARHPDDAPRWMRTDAVQPIGDFTETGDLQGDGTGPVGIYMRLPPDLFYGSVQNLAFHLGYRYNPAPLANESTLQTFVNTAYVSSTPMPHTDNATANLQTMVPVPVYDLRPFSNTFDMRFIFQIAKKGACQDTAPRNLQGSILKDSYLDLRGLPHMAVLPNLELFANAGFPYTRLADLAQTAVVLRDTPSPAEIELYLTLMGHFGAQTGYPALRVSVIGVGQMAANKAKDVLVLGTFDDMPGLASYGANLPVGFDRNGLTVRDTQGVFARMQHAWWKLRGTDVESSGSMQTTGELPDAMVEGMEWPRGSGRSMVMIAVRDPTIVPQFLKTFLKTSQSSDMAQSVSVLDGDHFVSHRVGSDLYHVGTLSLLLSASLFFEQYPWVLAIIIVLLCVVMAALLRTSLRRRARARLQGSE